MGFPHVLPDPPGVALVGGGFIGPVHAEALRRLGVPIVGLLGSTPDRARPLARRLGIPKVYDDLDALLADPDVQAVQIASPNAMHFEQARRAFEAGRHVLCEKPLAITSAETAELVALAAARPDQAAAVNYNIRFYPLCLEMKARIDRGDLGRLLSVTGSYTQDWLLRPTDYNWRVEPDGHTNLRAVADIGTHWMDLAQFVTGRPIRGVLADRATFWPIRQKPRGSIETFAGAHPGTTEPVAITTEDYAAVLLRFDDNLRGVFHVSQMNAGRKNRLVIEIAGTEGLLVWDSETPNRLAIGRRDAPNAWLERDPALLTPAAAAACHHPGGHAEGFPDTFKNLDIAFYEWIASSRSEPPAFPTWADGHREALLCEAIARSAREERWVPL